MESIKKIQLKHIELLGLIGLHTDLSLTLQTSTVDFDLPEWKKKLKELKTLWRSRRYLYLFIKADEQHIYSFYLGKSTTPNIKRLFNHMKGLQQAHQEIRLHSVDSALFYHRVYDQFFRDPTNIPLRLELFKWGSSRMLKNIFPFPIESNLSNAEALIIAYLASSFPQANINHDFITRTRWNHLNLEEMVVRVSH